MDDSSLDRFEYLENKNLSVIARVFADEFDKEFGRLINEFYLFRLMHFRTLRDSPDERKRKDILEFLDAIRIQVLKFIVLIRWKHEREKELEEIDVFAHFYVL